MICTPPELTVPDGALLSHLSDPVDPPAGFVAEYEPPESTQIGAIVVPNVPQFVKPPYCVQVKVGAVGGPPPATE